MVDPYLGIIVTVVQRQHTLSWDVGQRRRVLDHAPAAIHILHREYITVLHSFGHQTTEIHHFLQPELRHLDDGHGSLGNSGEGHFVPLPFWGGARREAVLLHHRAQFPELRGGQSLLIDGGIIVIARHVGCKTRAVGTCPMAETRTAMRHIE